MEIVDQVQDEFEAAFEQHAKRPAESPPPEAKPSEPDGAQEQSAQQAPTPPEPSGTQTDAEPPPQEQPETIESLQEKLRDALHRERSSANRISTFAKQNQQLADQVRTLREQMEQRAAAPAAPSQEAPTVDDVLSNAPELEAAVNKRIEKQARAIAKELEGRIQEDTPRCAAPDPHTGS